MTAQAPPSKTGPARVDELDGLRGLLALWVALSHILAWTGHWENPLPARLAGVWEVFVGAGPAVDIFIILSGFAISFLIHKRHQSYTSFMRGRFFRIYPVYLLCLALAIGTSFLVPFVMHTAHWRETIYFEWVRELADNESSAFGSHVFWHLTLLNGLLTKNFLPGATGTLLTPAWSITLEWQYYLVAPFLARGVRSGIGLLAIGLVAWLGLHYADIGIIARFFPGGSWHNPQLSFFPAQLPLFLIGIGSYHLYARLSDSPQFRPLTSITSVALVLLAILSAWHPVALTAWAIGFGGILIRGDDPVASVLARIRRILLHPWLQRLGKISFPLYLIHWPVIIAVLSLLLHAFPGISSTQALWVLIAIGIPIILLAADIIHRFVEKPGMDFGKRFDRRPTTSPESRTANQPIGD